MGQTISSLWTPPKISVVLIGLPSAGKTAIVWHLLHRAVPATIPARSMLEIDTVTRNGQSFDLFDYDGDEKYRPAWKSFFAPRDSIIFVVDSIDRDNMDEAREELHRLLLAEILKLKPVVVFANKQDSPEAMSVDELVDVLGIRDELEKGKRCHILGSSALDGRGLAEGLKWIRRYLEEHGREWK
ncbi:hypothetical protein CEP51_000427 [Fusarium floridanum]|uniref:ADP-ribosylation factor n=1 Tax=Fusarium floridanum TaxID=1325733 RepID=A0A428SN60_9HYPO|nr:hypothetical protein CEP51_000427 [Fusarium floridanum]